MNAYAWARCGSGVARSAFERSALAAVLNASLGAKLFVGNQPAVAWARRSEPFAYNTFVIEQDEG